MRVGIADYMHYGGPRRQAGGWAFKQPIMKRMHEAATPEIQQWAVTFRSSPATAARSLATGGSAAPSGLMPDIIYLGARAALGFT